jgi:hypothetical protein
MSEPVAHWPVLMLLGYPFMFIVLWAYGSWRPEHGGRACTIYDMLACALYGVGLCFLPSIWTEPRSILGLGQLYVPPLFLVFAGLVRNQLVFKSHTDQRAGETT